MAGSGERKAWATIAGLAAGATRSGSALTGSVTKGDLSTNADDRYYMRLGRVPQLDAPAVPVVTCYGDFSTTPYAASFESFPEVL